MDKERRKNLNWYVAEEPPATFSREELALYVLLLLQMRPLKLHRHRICLVGPPLLLVHGVLIWP